MGINKHSNWTRSTCFRCFVFVGVFKFVLFCVSGMVARLMNSGPVAIGKTNSLSLSLPKESRLYFTTCIPFRVQFLAAKQKRLRLHILFGGGEILDFWEPVFTIFPIALEVSCFMLVLCWCVVDFVNHIAWELLHSVPENPLPLMCSLTNAAF